ncbi:YbjN domain-containing protein [Mycobacterium conspicuum]|jgi:hypothetical protein|uniref:Uncharacterized protein n=1 Tax=Mycobacterium conspicuum TaxID=44010 RepID=A0A1X1SYN6_9MYCO|nr:YbjN domain-containing protein [Mycobacterium conspicuum]ORV36728.1 hypothetical protein AWC00_23870 [Mycobacterium conspicuum]BBZ39191.1 hypothetical protein MCNS_22540 [Mycobacterium conspicuum]
MTSETLCANLIERYLSTRGLPFLRGDHDGEYFCVVDAQPRRLHVHLSMSSSFGDMLMIDVTPSRFSPVTDRASLTKFADTFNRRNRGITAIVHGSADTQHLGLSARRSQWIREDISAEDFAAHVDRTIAAAIELFGQLAPVQGPSAAVLLREVG